MTYVFSRGLRLVVPYLDTCRVRVKAAWVGREIQQVRYIYITLTLVFACNSKCLQPRRYHHVWAVHCDQPSRLTCTLLWPLNECTCVHIYVFLLCAGDSRTLAIYEWTNGILCISNPSSTGGWESSGALIHTCPGPDLGDDIPQTWDRGQQGSCYSSLTLSWTSSYKPWTNNRPGLFIVVYLFQCTSAEMLKCFKQCKWSYMYMWCIIGLQLFFTTILQLYLFDTCRYWTCQWIFYMWMRIWWLSTNLLPSPSIQVVDSEWAPFLESSSP